MIDLRRYSVLVQFRATVHIMDQYKTNIFVFGTAQNATMIKKLLNISLDYTCA